MLTFISRFLCCDTLLYVDLDYRVLMLKYSCSHWWWLWGFYAVPKLLILCRLQRAFSYYFFCELMNFSKYYDSNYYFIITLPAKNKSIQGKTTSLAVGYSSPKFNEYACLCLEHVLLNLLASSMPIIYYSDMCHNWCNHRVNWGIIKHNK